MRKLDMRDTVMTMAKHGQTVSASFLLQSYCIQYTDTTIGKPESCKNNKNDTLELTVLREKSVHVYFSSSI